MVGIVRHRQTKEPATDRFHLNHRATPRLHTSEVILYMSGDTTYRPLRGAAVPTARKMPGTHVKYHHGKGETMRAKKVQVEIGKPKVVRIEVAAAQERGSAMTM
jgi:hypothetical protein